MRQRQLALQTIRGNLGDPCYSSTVAPLLHIKQEIQIPQVSSLTSSPDSSPSPATVAAGLVTTQAGAAAAGQHQLIAPSNQPGIGTSGGSGGGGTGNHNLHNLNPGLESKLWAANSTTTPGTKTFGFGEQSGQPHGGGNAAGYTPTPAAVLKSSPMIRDFLASIDDREWQSSLFGLLQSQTYNQCEVDLFELMCKVLDQNLFSQVDWARNSTFFKDLKVSLEAGGRSGRATCPISFGLFRAPISDEIALLRDVASRCPLISIPDSPMLLAAPVIRNSFSPIKFRMSRGNLLTETPPTRERRGHARVSKRS